jgi:hypothetical protein
VQCLHLRAGRTSQVQCEDGHADHAGDADLAGHGAACSGCTPPTTWQLIDRVQERWMSVL